MPAISNRALPDVVCNQIIIGVLLQQQTANYQFRSCYEGEMKRSVGELEVTEKCSCHSPRQQFSQACVLSWQRTKLCRATCSHWDNCFFCMSLLLLPSDDQVCLNSWPKSCGFFNGVVKWTSQQMKLGHVLVYACSLSKYGTPIERT